MAKVNRRVLDHKSTKKIHFLVWKRILFNVFVSAGIDPRKLFYFLLGLPRFLKDLVTLCSTYCLRKNKHKPLFLSPSLSDYYFESGVAKGHYFHQDLWVARQIYNASPSNHLDIGSRIDGFVSHLMVFRSLDVLDVRNLEVNDPSLNFKQANLLDTNQIKNLSRSYDSISCLHAIEHFGLGRYRDSINFESHLKALKNIISFASNDCNIYLSFPISSIPRLEFNTHYVFSPVEIPNLMTSLGYSLIEWIYVDDSGDAHENYNLNTIICSYGCLCGRFSRNLDN